MPPVGFEFTISAGEQPHTHALDRAAIIPYVLALVKGKGKFYPIKCHEGTDVGVDL
jgi:hypothetical protein